jgi:hypothetical protein
MKNAGILLVTILILCAVVAQGETHLQGPLPGTVLVQPEFFCRLDLKNPVEPEYPKAALEAGIQGEVLVFVRFDKKGNFVEAKPLRSSHDLLTESVLDALKGSSTKARADPSLNAIYLSELRFIFKIKDGKPEVYEASESIQKTPSKEFQQEIERRQKKSQE